jgi:regulator of protease activity HflC (stomatin/prohibitin superfamily)
LTTLSTLSQNPNSLPPQCPFCISTSEVAVIESCGKFTGLATPGINVVFFPWQQAVGKISYRVQQLDVKVETKTKDNVFITAVVSVQYQVLKEKVYEAFYSLTNPAQQITAHIYDVMRSQLPTLDLDAVFEAKEELAQAVKQALSGTMDKFGFQILQALITDLDPDARVKAAMNEINSSKRMKFAIMEQAEGAKILQVKSAEAEAEAKHLSGVGVAKQRRAIMDGLRTSIVDFGDGVEGTSPKDVMDLLLLSQYFDMLRETAGAPNCRTVFTSGAEETGRLGLLQASAGN